MKSKECFVDILGETGVQWFIDAGCPVNEQLVEALVRDVITDRIKGTLSQVGKDAVDIPDARAVRPGEPQPMTSQVHYYILLCSR